MIQILQEAAIRGGKVLRSYFRKKLLATNKTTHHNIVTQADIESQRAIYEYLKKETAEKLSVLEDEIGFIGEEGLYKPAKKYNFAIDPLDGTSNFSSGIDFFGISIALFIDGKLECGVIHMPIQDIMYYASRGGSSYKIMNKKAQRLLTNPVNLKRVYFNGNVSANDEARKIQLNVYNKLFHHFLGHIALNALAPLLCLVADNTIGLLISGNNAGLKVGGSIWDIAAGKLILEEAGGVMTDWNGKELFLELDNPQKQYSFLACHPKNLPKILEFMK